MSFDKQLAIETRMKEQWPIVWQRTTAVRTVFENSNAKEPNPPYIKFFIRHFDTREIAYSTGFQITYRRRGQILAQCFCPAGIGAGQARQMADAVVAAFEGRTFDGVTCEEGTVNEVGPDGALYLVNARVPFRYDEVRQVN